MGYNIKFVEQPEKQQAPVFPKRVQILEQDFAEKSRELSKAAGRPISVQYQYTQEDYLEKVFETYLHQNPSSLKTVVNACYRVKDLRNKGQEFYFWAGFKQCTTKLGHTEMFSWEQWGFHRSPKIGLQFNQERGQNEPHIIGYSNAFELSWDKDEIKKLLDSSYLPCEQFYIGKAGEREPIDVPYYIISNIGDFIDGKWDDLYDMGRLGISYKEPSLDLVEPARKQERENRRKAVGLKGEPSTNSFIS